ncbi:MAG: RNA polymerase sigma factor [Bacteroidales bacterium]|nr:RNA polymerase sigma factor [Bacteroidales bacterium]
MDAETFKRLVIPLQPVMQQLAERLLGDAMLAEDAVQDTVLRLWQQHQETAKVKNLEAYCCTMLKNHCIDLLRQRQPTVSIEEENRLREISAENPTHMEERYQRVMACIEMLPPQQQSALRMKYEQQLENGEIAKRLQISMNNLYVTLSRACRSLRDMYEERYL